MTTIGDQIRIFLTSMVYELPTLIVCIVACVLILTRLNRSSRSKFWGLLGFVIVFFLCILAPIEQVLVQSWVIQGGHLADRAWALTISSVFLTGLRTIAYVFLLMAILAGRSTSELPPPKP